MIEFSWDSRKAERNERKHRISFPLAQAAIESRLGVEIDEQYREGEWRTIIVAPLRGIFLIHITFAFYPQGDDEESSTRSNQKEGQVWTGNEGVIRIISARAASADEQALYFAARPQAMG